MKRIVSMFLVLSMMLVLVSFHANASEAVASGTCGDALTWVLDDEGTLKISGTGAMTDYSWGGSPWYNSRDSIISVIIDVGVTSVGEHAFYDCSSMTNVSISNSITSIGAWAFCKCHSLASISIPDSVKRIGANAFQHCSSLVDVVIPDSVTSVGDYTFMHCNKLRTVVISNQLKRIGYSLFNDCGSLVSVIIPASVTYIDDHAFADCNNLTEVTIPTSVTWIGEYAFYECTKLERAYYLGTKEQWNAINIWHRNEDLEQALRYFSEHTHAWDEGQVTTESTCVDDGVKTYACTVSVCKETKTETIPATQKHTPDNTDCTKDTYCTVCQNLIRSAGQHAWNDGQITTEPTCEGVGETVYTCTADGCGATKSQSMDSLGHNIVYTADGAVITENCSRNDHTATATLAASDAVYTGKAVKTATVNYAENWKAGEVAVVYENNVGAGTAKASITVGEITVSVNFDIAKATEYTLFLSGLNQTTTSLQPVTATIMPDDPTVQIAVEYEVYTAAGKIWTAERPSAAGTYPVRAYLFASENIAVSAEPIYTTGVLKITAPAIGGGFYVPSVPTEEPKQEESKSQTPAKTFADVPENAWFGSAVAYAVEKKLMRGISETEFAPNGTVTRAMVMTVLARQSGAETDGGSTWYEKAMQWAKDNGISDGTMPEGVITREQLATMLYRVMKQPAASADLSKFTDADGISDYAKAAMQWATKQGLITGVTETTLDPKGETTRAQLATILMRFVEMSR